MAYINRDAILEITADKNRSTRNGSMTCLPIMFSSKEEYEAYRIKILKQDLAREIFWEIDKLLTSIITDDENGTKIIGVDMQKYYALKMKYTEGKS